MHAALFVPSEGLCSYRPSLSAATLCRETPTRVHLVEVGRAQQLPHRHLPTAVAVSGGEGGEKRLSARAARQVLAQTPPTTAASQPQFPLPPARRACQSRDDVVWAADRGRRRSGGRHPFPWRTTCNATCSGRSSPAVARCKWAKHRARYTPRLRLQDGVNAAVDTRIDRVPSWVRISKGDEDVY